ncbi:hypothetical protein TUA1478L_21370 [Lactiplantibacillus plantarum]
MSKTAVFTATILAAIVGCLLMGLVANFPVALAPGMGLNAFFTYTVVQEWHIPWQTALAGVFVAGILFILLTLSKLRDKLINLIPSALKYAVSAGIGLFIAFQDYKPLGLSLRISPTRSPWVTCTVPPFCWRFSGLSSASC